MELPKRAPHFRLLDQDGIERDLKDYKDRWLVLYFYPRDNSPGCIAEACEFRDEHQIIAQFGNAEIIGISKDSVESHKAFARKHHLNFPLLSDVDRKVIKAYGAWRGNKAHHLLDKPFATKRNTYIINPKGMIVRQYLGVVPRGHAEEIINDLQRLQGIAA